MNRVPTNPAQRIKSYLVSVATMKSKHTLQNAPSEKSDMVSPEKTMTMVCGHLADIELKLDHIIESIKGSLHRMNLEDKHREEVP